MQIGRMTNYCR